MGRNLSEFPFQYDEGVWLKVTNTGATVKVVGRQECNKLDKDVSSDQEATLFDDYEVTHELNPYVHEFYETWELEPIG